MTTFKVLNKTLTILRENFLKLLHTNESLVTYLKAMKLPITELQNSPQFWWLCSLWWFTQFRVLLSPIALKVVGPLLLDSNSSRDGTNPPFQFPIWQPTNKETKRQAITKDKK